MKPGYYTTEWWTAMAALAAPVIAMTLHVDSDTGTKAISGAIVAVGSAVIAVVYAVSRTFLKVNSEIQAGTSQDSTVHGTSEASLPSKRS